MGWQPDVLEQEWLLDCGRSLVRHFGEAPLQRRSLSPAAVGDAGALGTPEAVLAVVRYLGLPPRELTIVEDEVSASTTVGVRAVWQDATSLVLAFSPVRSAPSQRAADLCHALVSVERASRDVVFTDPVRESRMTDLTAVWLGLGAVLADGAEPTVFLDGPPGPPGPLGDMLVPIARRLSTQAVCFALAMRVVARHAGCISAWRVGSSIGRIPRHCYWESIRALRHPRGAVAERLRLKGDFGTIAVRSSSGSAGSAPPESVDERE